MNHLSQILSTPHSTKSVFCKLLTKNDDSGRHGIVVPVDAYAMLPNILTTTTGSSIGLNCDFSTWSGGKKTTQTRTINYKFYHQKSHSHPERRLTNFRSKELNNSSAKDLFILAKTATKYEAHYIPSTELNYQAIIRELVLDKSPAGGFFIDLNWKPTHAVTISPQLSELLNLYDGVKATWYKTVNASSQGVGTTFESLIGIKANNSSLADYKGIEIKAYKLKGAAQPGDQDLFLKEPAWANDLTGEKLKNKNIVEKYGYRDELNRQALKVRLSIKPNSQGLYIEADDVYKEIRIKHNTDTLGSWSFKDIEKRLGEKHKHVAFIGAESKSSKGMEEFQYRSFLYCSNPSAENFFRLINESIIKVELRMHINEKGVIRNHGTQFRIKDSELMKLYSVHVKLR
ncbi:MAG: hypothetical protein DI539_14590 [Flavobacterium psychrophilum]|nr:MAG: hypothetical protein DI539_14590 [Flavobacterium psychrophilum]